MKNLNFLKEQNLLIFWTKKISIFLVMDYLFNYSLTNAQNDYLIKMFA